MIDVVFDVRPAGICGMNNLAKFLERLKKTTEISDWRPKHEVRGTGGLKYVVQLADDDQAARALTCWTSVRTIQTMPSRAL